MKKKRIKKLPKSQQLLSPIITDISESNDNPYIKYAKKYFNSLGETSNKKISMLAEGLREILNDKTNYKINLEQTDKPYDIIEKYIPNMKCPVTRKYLEEIVRKLKNDEDLTKVQEQVKRHIINGTKKHSPKPIPNVGDTVITDDGNKGIVTEKRGLKFKIKTNNGYITENLKNIIFVKNNKNKKIKEEVKLDKFFESFDYDKQIVTELFKADSNVEIDKEGNTYYFAIDDNDYRVYLNGKEILFANADEVSSNRFKPMKNNKNQFLVLNTVLKCIEDMLKSEKGYYYFTGDESLGLAKLYNTMFNRLKNDAVNLGYVAIKLNSLKSEDDKETFCFYPKSDFTIDNYESIIYSYPYAEFYGFKLPDNYIPIPENNYYYDVEEISDNEYYFKPNEILECEVSFEENDSDGKNISEINIKITDESALKNKYVQNTICRIIKNKMFEDYKTYYFYTSNTLEDKIAHITSDRISREYYVSSKKVNNYDLYMFTPMED